jgi:hypothetical protein
MPIIIPNVFCLFAAEGGATPTKDQIWNYCGHVKLRASGENAQLHGNSSKNEGKSQKIEENYKKTPDWAVANAQIFSNLVFCSFAAEGGATATKYQI